MIRGAGDTGSDAARGLEAAGTSDPTEPAAHETAVVQTVLGPVPSSDLGPVLAHDHLLCHQPDIGSYEHSGQVVRDEAMWEAPLTLETIGWVRINWLSNRSNIVLDEYDVALAELAKYREAGGGTVADPTTSGLGRDPLALASLSRDTGIHVLMGCGYYVAETHPEELRRMSHEEIAASIVRDLTVGVGDTGVRAGFIGEVGCTWPIQDEERRVLEASVAAQHETGVALMIHPGRDPRSPFEILSFIEEAGGDLGRVIMGHVDRTVPGRDDLVALAEMGSYLSFDVFGLETSMYPFFATGLDMPSDAQRLEKLEHVRDAGRAGQLVVSHDICTKHRLSRYGGHGYDYLLTFVMPWLRRRGASQDFVDQILVGNPQRAFGGVRATRGADRNGPREPVTA